MINRVSLIFAVSLLSFFSVGYSLYSNYLPSSGLSGSYPGVTNVGSLSSLTVVGPVVITGNVTLSSACYGSFFVSGNATATNINGGWTTVTVNAVSGPLKRATQTGGRLTLSIAGTYFISWSGYLSAKTAADDLHFAIGVSGVSPYPGSITEFTDASSLTQAIMGGALVTVTAGQTVSLIVVNLTSSTRDCTIEYLNFKALKMLD